MEIKQYHLVLVNLDPTVGSEMQKTRPCLIVSPDEMNKHLQTIVIAPVTSSAKPYPTRVKVTGENITGWVVLDQIRTVDKLRIIKVLGKLTTTEIEAIKSVIRETYVD
ncbi:MAG: type II toxin-antitoxin system PemK/MazF family toxin [Chitinophagaceae bacterium]|jgi:mRNA interferase MazF|nr:type II toxin-antitoxin system PemK/MazF family toxin [Chitinophagaceae bacterium]